MHNRSWMHGSCIKLLLNFLILVLLFSIPAITIENKHYDEKYP